MIFFLKFICMFCYTNKLIEFSSPIAYKAKINQQINNISLSTGTNWLT